MFAIPGIKTHIKRLTLAKGLRDFDFALSLSTAARQVAAVLHSMPELRVGKQLNRNNQQNVDFNRIWLSFAKVAANQ